MGGINFSPILFILSKKLYLCIKQELFGRIATQFTEFMTVAKSLPRSLRNTYKLLISNSFLFIYRILRKNNMNDNVIISNQNMGGKTNSTLWPRCILPRTRPKEEKRYFEASIN